MSKLMVLVGISGSGKSTVAQSLAKDGATILSSDNMRAQLWGDANDQQKPGVIFDTMQNAAIAALRDGKDVIYDATNLSAKHRAALLKTIRRNVKDVLLECHIVVTDPQRCIANQQARERQVSKDVIHKQLMRFQVPVSNEGWTEPIVVHNPFYRAGMLDELMNATVGVSQTGPWHQETVDVHQRLVVNHAQYMGYPDIIKDVARLHDIGKPYTRTVGDDGNTHFYGHACVGAYLYLCAVAQDGVLPHDIWLRAVLINRHMDVDPRNNHDKLRTLVGDDIYAYLRQLHEADEYGAVRAEHKDMHVLDFMNAFHDWKMRLQAPPFCCNVKQNGDYVLLQYQQLNSDFSSRVVQECRGSIFRQRDGQWQYVCRPFDKFFNYGQAEASNIDWSTARVLEKVDGCFTANDTVLISDGSTISFAELKERLEHGEQLSVLSYNFDKRTAEFKPIVRLKCTPSTGTHEWLKVINSLGGVMTVTRNHVIYVQQGDGTFIEKTADRLLVKHDAMLCVNNDKPEWIEVDWLHRTEWRGFAEWYMADGFCEENRYLTLLAKVDAVMEMRDISRYYAAKGYANTVHGTDRDDHPPICKISFTEDASERIWEAIRSYIPKDMQHKLPWRHRGYYSQTADTLRNGYIVDIVECEGFSEKFDLEVADNHNYFCDGVLVHNSLMKVWYDDSQWRLSTNGNIDAFKTGVSDLGISFGDLFTRALGYDFNTLCAWLDPAYTYMFELTSPDSQIVIPYSDGVWYLSRRHTATGKEEFDRPALNGVKLPQEFRLATMDDVLKVVQSMSKDEEGVVVNDAAGHRIKVKSPEYLLAAHLANNKMVSNRNLVTYMQEGKIDDFLAYCPQYTARVQDIQDRIRAKCDELDAAWERYQPVTSLSRREFAAHVAKEPCKAYLFAKLTDTSLTSEQYIMGLMVPSIMRTIGLKSDAPEEWQPDEKDEEER